MIARREGGKGVGGPGKISIKKKNQVPNKAQLRLLQKIPGGTFLQIQTYTSCFFTLIYICKRTAFLQKYIL